MGTKHLLVKGRIPTTVGPWLGCVPFTRAPNHDGPFLPPQCSWPRVVSWLRESSYSRWPTIVGGKTRRRHGVGEYQEPFSVVVYSTPLPSLPPPTRLNEENPLYTHKTKSYTRTLKHSVMDPCIYEQNKIVVFLYLWVPTFREVFTRLGQKEKYLNPGFQFYPLSK